MIFPRLCLLSWLVCFLHGISFAQPDDSLLHRIIMIGDAGLKQNEISPEIKLARSLFTIDKRTTVVFLGDNIYPSGLPDSMAKGYLKAKDILDKQMLIGQDNDAAVYFIPGNHDWKEGRPDGWEQIMHQSFYVTSLNKSNIHFVPEDGCPGPAAVNLGEEVVLIMMDSQWWLQKYDKPGVESDCDCKTKDEVLVTLKDILYHNRNKLVVFAAHHPMKTHGRHGGYYILKDHLFPLTAASPGLYIPLPVIGSIYPLGRKIFGNIQDMKHPVYNEMISKIEPVLNTHPYCVRIAGHDHNLQLIEENEKFYIVSGAGSKTAPVKNGKGTLFAYAAPGFSVLEVYKNGQVKINFYSSQNKNPSSPLFSKALPDYVFKKEDTLSFATIALPDSAVVAASTSFQASNLKRWLLGSNYRKEWRAHVKAKVFDIRKEYGGLTPTTLGGGHQTQSLRLEDSSGKEYVLRSIHKRIIDEAIPANLAGTFVKDIIADGISSSYPYSSLSVPVLATAAGVPHATPRLVYIPDDPAFGRYRVDFAGQLFLFEEREPASNGKTYSTPKLLSGLMDDNDNKVDQHAFLRARMLDIFMMDFDRHEDQWRWGKKGNNKENVFYPIPRDRDQAFFMNQGLIPWVASQSWIAPQLQGFRPHARNIKTFNVSSINLDRNFLNIITKDEWIKEADRLIDIMTDSVLEKALHQQPSDLYKYSGDKIVNTLKARKKFLETEAITYYKFLSKDVDVTGSNKREYFDITRNEDGSVTLLVYKISKSGDTSTKLYKRIFWPSETKEIRLYGMGGDDLFNVHGNAGKSIKLRIIGGQGKDTVWNKTGVRRNTIVYDLSSESNVIEGPVRNKTSNDPELNQWEYRSFRYNVLFKFLSANYNVDDGVYLGLMFRYTTQKFRKKPYYTQQSLVINHSLATSAYNFKYSLDVTKAVGKLNLLANADIRAPDFTINFFGYGNTSLYDKSVNDDIRYYQTRFNTGEISLQLKKKISDAISLSAGPSFQFFSMQGVDNKDRFITKTNINGLDSATLFKNKYYIGGLLRFTIDNRNSTVMPSGGVLWNTTVNYYSGINGVSKNFCRLNTDFSVYANLFASDAVVFSTRFGGGINIGKYEFFQAQYLSATENLRGFRKNRFAGDKMVYNNTELRISLAEFKTYLFPGKLGVLLFNDIGRVWYAGESSEQWHDGYGAGLWVAPLYKIVIAVSYTHSKEGGLPLVSFGFQF